MTGSGPALLVAAAGVGFGHAILPDHWVPLAVLGRTRRYPLSRIARLSGLAGVAHVLVSILLGALIIAIGLQLRSTIQHAQDTIIGCILIATGLGFLVPELCGHGRHHPHPHPHARPDAQNHAHVHLHADGHPHPDRHDPAPGRHHDQRRASGRLGGLAAVMVPFGAAASPDLTILPVFLAATTTGAATAVGSVAVFAAVTIGTIITLTLAGARGGHQVQGEWLERWGSALTAGVLVVIGALVLAQII